MRRRLQRTACALAAGIGLGAAAAEPALEVHAARGIWAPSGPAITR